MHTLFVRIAPDDPALAEWLALDASGTPQRAWQKGPLEELSTVAGARRSIWLAASEDILLTRADVPSRNQKQLRQAAPYALEEELADDVEELHFAFPANVREQPIPVAIAARELMDRWTQDLEDAGLTPQLIVPDVLSLPLEQGAWSMLLEADRCLVRTGAWSGFACDRDLAVPMLEAEINEAADHAPQVLRLWCCDGDAPALEGLELSVQRERCEQGALAVMAKGFSDAGPLNLLQGDYEAKGDFGGFSRPWRFAAGLAIAWIALLLTGQGLEYRKLAAQKRELTAAIEQVYRKTFPDTKRVVNPRVQMQQQIDALRGSSASGETGFLALLDYAATAINETKAVNVIAINYRGGHLDFDLSASDPSTLDALKQRIDKNPGVHAELQSVSASGKEVTGRLRLEART